MKAPDIQFAEVLQPWRVLGLVLMALGVVVAVMGLGEYATALRELRRVEADLVTQDRDAERRRAAAEVRAQPQIPEQRVNAINNAIARLNIPWSELFAAFESNNPKDVALLALLPDARKRSLVVQAEALSPRAMIEFIEQLRKVPGFQDAYLTKHERRTEETGQPYRFAIEVHWNEFREH